MIELERWQPRDALARCRELLASTSKLDEGSDASFARALEAVARLQLGELEAVYRLDRALAELREADSHWMIAYVQNLASEVDIASARGDAARARAVEALEAATVAERCNEITVAHALLARLALHAEDREGAITHLEALQKEPTRAVTPSARARGAVGSALRAYEAYMSRGSSPL
jgi:hypothetical protein